MSIRRKAGRCGSNCPGGAAIWRAAVGGLVALCLHAQAPGSITTRSLPSAGIAVIDAQQNVYIASGGGCAGLFDLNCTPMSIIKVDAAGNTVFNFVDNQNGVGAEDLAVDSAGEVYVACMGASGFVLKLSADGSKSLYAAPLPSGLFVPDAIRLDAQGNAYIAGITTDHHPFVTKMSADGSTFVYTVKLPGSGASPDTPDTATALAVDAAGNAVVTGTTYSSDFAVTASALQAALAGTPSAYVTKLDPTGKILFSTFLGGTGGSYGQSIQLDSTGNIYAAGISGPGFPTTPGTYQPSPIIQPWSGGTTGYLAKVKSDGSVIIWATYTVSNGWVPSAEYPITNPMWLAVSGSGDVYLATQTLAGFVTTTSAPQACFGGFNDVVLLHLNAQSGLADSTYLGAYESSPFGLALPGDGSVLVAAQTVNAATANYVPVLARVTFGQPGSSPPACLSQDIVNAASFMSGFISPGEYISLTGLGIGPDAGVVYQPGPQGQAPTTLGGVSVTFNGIPAPLIYVQSRQVNAQVPFEIDATPTTGSASVAVALTYKNQTFGPFHASANWLGEPGIFRLQPGVSTQAAALNQDGSVNGPTDPASAGSYVTFFGTGYGPLVPPCATGGLNPPTAVPLFWTGSPIANLTTDTPYALQYEGSAPTLLCGIVQFNFQVPITTPSGPFLLTPYINPGYGSTIFVR